MHELSLVNNLLNRLDDIIRKNNAKRLVSVRIRVGALSHISPKHLKEHLMLSDILKNAIVEVIQREDIDNNAQDIILESVELEVDE